MRKLIQVGLVAGLFAAAAPAGATDFTFDMRNDGIGTPPIAIGNTFFYQATAANGETLDVMVSGWSKQLDGSILKATVASWDPNGLGIFQQGESTEGALHQIDNVNGWEFLSLQFSKAVTLSSGVLNSYALAQIDANGNPVKDARGNIVYRDYVDNDAYLNWGTTTTAWNAGLGLDTTTGRNAFNAGRLGAINTSSDGTAAQTFNLTNATGNTWLIGGSINGPDSLNDAFKLAGLTVRTTGSTVVTPVPEPTTWAMMLVGFGMVGAATRYRRRKTTIVHA